MSQGEMTEGLCRCVAVRDLFDVPQTRSCLAPFSKVLSRDRSKKTMAEMVIKVA